VRWKHGLYSAEALPEHKRERELLTQFQVNGCLWWTTTTKKLRPSCPYWSKQATARRVHRVGSRRLNS
jgi:hypothetical protein